MNLHFVFNDSLFFVYIFSSKHSETSRSNRSTPVKKPTRLVSYIDPEDEDETADRTVNDEDGLSMDFEKNEAELGEKIVFTCVKIFIGLLLMHVRKVSVWKFSYYFLMNGTK